MVVTSNFHHAVRCVRQRIWASGGPSNYTPSLSPSPGPSPAYIPQHQPSKGPGEAERPNGARLSWADATVHLLRQEPELDRVGLVGLRGPNIPGRILGPGHGNAGPDLPQLASESRLHRVCF